MHIFRDETDLGVNPGLWSSIEKTLANSRYLILLASPQAARSEGWVAKEVDWWLQNRGTENLLLVLTAGTIEWGEADFDWSLTDALPKLLSGSFAEEPLWLDLREEVTNGRLTLDDEGFQGRAASIAATLHGIAARELIGRELIEQRRAKRYAWSAGAALLALLIAVGIFAGLAKHEAEVTRLQVQAMTSSSLLDAEPQRALYLAIRAASHNATSVWTRGEMQTSVLRSLPAAVQRARELTVVSAHGGRAVTSVAFHPYDAATLASGGADGTIAFWRLRSGRLELVNSVRAIEGDGLVRGVAFDPKGELLATGGDDGWMRLWQLNGEPASAWKIAEEGGSARDPCGPEGGLGFDNVPEAISVCDVVFAPDGDSVFAGDSAGHVHRWSRDGKPLGSRIDSHARWVSALAVGVMQVDGTETTYIASAGDDDSPVGEDTVVRVWSLDGRPLGQFGGDDYGWIASLDADDSNYGSTLAAARVMKLYPLEGGTILRWTPDGRALSRLDDQVVSARSVAFGPHLEDTLAAGWEDGSIRVWLRMGGMPLGGPLIGHRSGSAVVDLDFSRDGKSLASAGHDGTVRLWDVSPLPRLAEPFDGKVDSAELVEMGPVPGIMQDRKIRRLDSLGSSVSVPDGRMVAAWSTDGRHAVTIDARQQTLEIWQVDGDWSAPPVWRTRSPEPLPRGATVVLAKNLERVAWTVNRSSRQRGLFVASRASPGEAVELAETRSNFDWFAFSEDGRRLATLDNGHLVVWDIDTHERFLDTTLFGESSWSTQYLSAGRRLLTRHGGGLQLWHFEPDFGRAPSPIGESIPYAGDASFAGNGFLLTVDESGMIESWNLDAELLGRFQHEGGVTSLAATADRALIVTGYTADVPQGGGNSVIRLWTGDGQQLAEIDWLGEVVEEVGFTAGGTWAFGRSVFNRFSAWPAHWMAWRAVGCERLQSHPGIEDKRLTEQVRSDCENIAPLPFAKAHQPDRP